MLVGLTGGVATGKSTVAEMLAGLGAVVLSADQAAREVAAAGSPVLARIVSAFGPQYLLPDGGLNRSLLAQRVFSNPDDRKILESITHPAILARLQEQIAEAQARNPDSVIVVEAPLLFEAGIQDWFDRIITVTASEDKEERRLAARNALSSEEAHLRIAAQMPLAEKVRGSDNVIVNDGTLADLRIQVKQVWSRLMGASQ